MLFSRMLFGRILVMKLQLSKRLFQIVFSTFIILSMFCLYGCNLPNKEKDTEKRLDKKNTQEISEVSETDINKTTNEHLFDTFIGKDKEYIKNNANQFTEKDGHYIIFESNTEETNDSVEVIFNENNEAEFFVWNCGKTLDPSELSDYLVATVQGPEKLGIKDNHETQKKGSLFGNQMTTIYKDNIMCLYDFNDEFYLKCGLSTSFSDSEIQLTNNIWRMSYYVDEFGLPGKKPYITNTKEIVGTFNNSATSKSKLKVKILVDKDSISFMLYEYGRSLVKNSSTRNFDFYKIIMLDSQNHKVSFEESMNPNSDRISTLLYKQTVLDALLQNGSVSFYIEKKDRPTTNYTFTIPADNGFSVVYKLLQEHCYPFCL